MFIKRLGVLFFGVVILVAGSAFAGVTYQVDSETGNVYFKIQSKDQGSIIIGGPGSGAIYFKTEKDFFVLKGYPSWTSREDGGFQGKWRQPNGRSLNVEFKQAGDNWDLHLSSDTGCDITRWGLGIPAGPGEYFTGCFERVVDGNQKESWKEGLTTAMNLRGEKVSMMIRPTLSLYSPFYLSSRGYGIHTHGTWPGWYDFAAADKDYVRIIFEGPSFSCRIYTGPEPVKIIQDHALDTGPSIVPPKWTFSPWRWRDEHDNNPTYYEGTPVEAPYCSQVVEDVLLMKYFDIPCSVYWVDRPWAEGPDGYSDFVWDPERMPEAPEMIRWLDKQGMKFILWIAPWVMGNMAQQALAEGYNLAGQQIDLDKSAEDLRILVDFSNPEGRRWWQQQGIRRVLEDGVAGFKLDRAEEVVPEDHRHWNFAGQVAREFRNDYPVQYVKATHEIAEEIRGDDFLLMPRAGYTGSARYGVFWGGDIGSTEYALRCAIIAAQRAAVMGYPIWGSDTGGYWQGDLDPEVTARWLAFSCFNPIFEVGPTENRGFWDMKREPSYNAELIAVWRLYATLHDDLADYSYKYAKEASRTGMPVIRPLFVVYPDQPQAWQDWQTFLYGEDILVSAVWEKGTTSQTLYLPAGEKWQDAWDLSKVYEGGQSVTIQTPGHRIPIFIRSGSGLKLGDLERLYQESLEKAKKKPDMKKLEKNMKF